MSSAHLLLRGDFLHASLYFGHLTVVAYDTTIVRFDLPWLSTSLPSDGRGLPVAGFQETPEPTALAVDDFEQVEPPSGAEVLTLHSYDGVTYFGGEDGLWGLAEKRHDPLAADPNYSHLTDRPALDVAMTFGVGAVAHGDGLSVLPLRSSWLADEYFRPAQAVVASPAHTVTWTHHDLLSRSAPLLHSVIPATFEFRTRDDEKHYVFQGLDEVWPRELMDGGQCISATAPRSYATWESAGDSATLFRKQRYGWRTDWFNDELQPDCPSEFRLVGAIRGRVISLREFGRYLLCELSDRLSIVDDEGHETVLLDHPATDIRVYPRSRRYRRIVTAVSEQGVHVFEPKRLG